MQQYKGNPVSKGIAVGPVYRYEPFDPKITESEIAKEAVDDYLERYRAAKSAARAELDAIIEKLSQNDPDKAKIFAAHIEILDDEAIDEEITELVSEDLCCPDWAIFKTYGKFVKLISKTKDPLIAERVADLFDVRNRLLRNWVGRIERNLASLEKPVIVAAHDLFPSDTATLDRSKVLAIVTEVGGATSHSAIIARSYEIPALLGVSGLMGFIQNDADVVVDAVNGNLFCEPDSAMCAEYGEKRAAYLKKAADVKKYIDSEPVTADGARIELGLNIGSADATELEGEKYVDLVGLFRTEFLYMGRDVLPTEDEQYDIYKKVLQRFGERPVTLRTLDIGGDKTLQCMNLPKEDNPFLGKRALRLCFDEIDIFRTQLRAALRASVHGNLWIMLPMVGSMDDIHRAKQIIDDVKKELDADNIPYAPNVKLGIMIEIPSIAIIADIAAQEVDFASIGTNDLCQYSTAVDRLNPAVSSYYQSYHPAMFRLIGYVVEQFNKAGKPICVCGELGGDVLAAPVLIGLGMRKLSMGLASVAQIKRVIRGLSTQKARELADTARSLHTAAQVEEYLKNSLSELI